MVTYLARRLVLAAITTVAITLVTFIILHLPPVDFARHAGLARGVVVSITTNRERDEPQRPASRLFRAHADAPLRSGTTSVATVGGVQQNVAHASISLRRFTMTSPRRYAFSTALPTRCARLNSMTRPGKFVRSSPQVLRLARNLPAAAPWRGLAAPAAPYAILKHDRGLTCGASLNAAG